eukprot:3400555-Karenia_brevis.AAC.1
MPLHSVVSWHLEGATGCFTVKQEKHRRWAPLLSGALPEHKTSGHMSRAHMPQKYSPVFGSLYFGALCGPHRAHVG